MSGFDTSQPIADAEALKEVDGVGSSGKAESSESGGAPEPDEAAADELGDATPGPR